ncbi:hypothetical protein [Abyssalbus ytuae]|uniref:Outer membrane protein beta-barrel domain-containing protein n=1 Tax=Abyssalbus ytuae TaxID=2926907 RepID=A0A9E6ZNP1_9FLAO|nr:hypothetical protein [Abyssalbus ytuae]UOB19289.1 hypothetical protein MQE35_08320 [Abyssalbus ytuae]
MKKIVFLFFAFSCILTYSQRFPEVRNFNGLKAGVNFFNINSDEIDFKSGTGFNVAYTRRLPLAQILEANLFVEYQQNNFSVDATNLVTVDEVDYKLHSVKLGALANFKAYGPYLSIVAGPVLQFNDKLKYDDEFENHLVINEEEEPITVNDLSQISGFNFLFAAGISAGEMNYKLYGLYEFGINNILSSVPLSGGNSLTGHSGILTVGAIIYF